MRTAATWAFRSHSSTHITQRGVITRGESFTVLDSIVTILALLLFSNAIVSWFYQEFIAVAVATESDGNPAFQIAIAICYAYAAVRLIAHRADLSELLPARAPALALVALAVASTIWADNPALALRRSVAFTGTTGFALFGSLRVGAIRTMWLLGIAMGTAAVLSILAAVLLPEMTHESSVVHEGLLKGVFQQKNLLGRAMVVGVFAAVAIAEAIPKRRFVAALI